MKIDGWFVSPHYEDRFDEFWDAKCGGYGYSSRVLKPLVFMVLFGKALDSNTCYEVCSTGRTDCPMNTSSFCQLESVSKSRDAFGVPNYYTIYRKTKENMGRYEDNIIKIVGQHRYDSFIEFITYNAAERFHKYTRREQREKGLNEPIVFDAPFIGLEEISDDPWELWLNNEIQQGETGCLQFLDSGFLAC